jgi:hypothetical protein
MRNKKFISNDCLFFGDASTDYEAAKANQIHFFTWFTPELSSYWQDHISEFVAQNFDMIS